MSGAMSGPYYQRIRREVDFFQHAYRNRLALMIKGPTGCGKMRLVEAMAAKV
jgi:nitric oxide reductase NorQ protein